MSQGAAGALAGVQLHWVPEIGASSHPSRLRGNPSKDPHTIQTTLICLENTHNSAAERFIPGDD